MAGVKAARTAGKLKKQGDTFLESGKEEPAPEETKAERKKREQADQERQTKEAAEYTAKMRNKHGRN
jgi:hypothetical protein